MPASPIRKLVPLANRAVERGIKVYHLNIGQPDLPTPECGLEAMRRIDRTVLEYSPSEGIRSFREKLVKYYAKYNIIVDADDIIITTGGSEAVFFSFMACLDPGDELIVPEPAYANYMAFAISCGAVIKTIPSTIEEGFALPSLEKFESLITPRTKAILICNPNNPTGYLYTQKEMNQLRDLVKKYDLFLFSDEVYREFCYTGAPYISAFHLKGIENNVVRTLSPAPGIGLVDLQRICTRRKRISPDCNGLRVFVADRDVLRRIGVHRHLVELNVLSRDGRLIAVGSGQAFIGQTTQGGGDGYRNDCFRSCFRRNALVRSARRRSVYSGHLTKLRF